METVAGKVLVGIEPGPAQHLHGRAGRNHHGNVILLAGLVDADLDAVEHILLVVCIVREIAVGVCMGICPGLMPYYGRPGVGALLAHYLYEIPQPWIVTVPAAALGRALLHGDDIPGFIPKAIHEVAFLIFFNGLPLVLGGLQVHILMAVCLIFLTVPLEGASADIQASDYHIMDTRSLQQVRQILGGVVREGIADGKDSQSVRVLGEGVIHILFLSGQVKGSNERSQYDKDSLHIFLYLW